MTGDPRTRKDSPKFIWTPCGGRWAQEVSAGTKVPHTCRIQAKKRNLLGSLCGYHNCKQPNKEKIHNLKLRATFYLVGICRTLSPGGSISNNPKRTAPRKYGECQVI